MAFSAAPELRNRTPFVCEPAFLTDENGRPLLVPIIKATFTIADDGHLAIASSQRPVDLAGTYWGDPDTSSHRAEPECAFIKPATDIVLLGHAVASRPGTREMMVSLKVGQVAKVVQVFGDRVWRKPLVGAAYLTPPQPFERIPLVYERAFGGWDRGDPDPVRHTFEPRNPAGTGFRIAWPAGVDAVPAPNIEDPRHRIASFGDRPPPAGFGFTGPHWQPRARFAGTYDQVWSDTRMPLLPTDFDRRFFNAASTGLVAPGYLSGTEEVIINGVVPQGRLAFRLPAVPPPALNVTLREADSQMLETRLDTVLIDTDTRELVLIWRAHVAVREVPHDVVAITLDCVLPPSLAR